MKDLTAQALRQEAGALEEKLADIYRRLHMHPELGFQEKETAEIIRAELTKLGLPSTAAQTGTIVDLPIEGNMENAVLLRADIDALPIQEATGLPYASQNDGVMHACGHDSHATMLLGAAQLLQNHRDQLSRPVRLVFQPAEETLGGAAFMVEKGVLQDVTEAYCMHVRSDPRVGLFYTMNGCINASCDNFDVIVKGKGCHGAYPEGGVDAAVIAAHILLALQDLLSRETWAGDNAVLTIGRMQGGTARNILCGEMTLEGTLRTMKQSVRERLCRRIEEVASGIAAAMRGEAQVVFRKNARVCRTTRIASHTRRIPFAGCGMTTAFARRRGFPWDRRTLANTRSRCAARRSPLPPAIRKQFIRRCFGLTRRCCRWARRILPRCA